MAWLDFLSALPLNPVLREKLATAEAKVKEAEAQQTKLAATIAEKDLLLEQQRAEIGRLKQAVAGAEAAKEKLSQDEQLILAPFKDGAVHDRSVLFKKLKIEKVRFDYAWEQLVAKRRFLVHHPGQYSSADDTQLTQAGRKWLVQSSA